MNVIKHASVCVRVHVCKRSCVWLDAGNTVFFLNSTNIGWCLLSVNASLIGIQQIFVD